LTPIDSLDSISKPSNSSSTCPICGSKLKSRSGLVVCECRFKADRQFIGVVNVLVRGQNQ
ncbi:hypothetical protein DRN44_09355, partial [Thermococci archaeon]